jgi:branched-chain amino acid transport system substrate-binding protein
MSTMRRRMRITSVVAGIGIVAVLAAGCARGADTDSGGGDASEGPAEASPGITDTSLTFGITSPLTGATAGPGNCTVDGALAYFGVKNAEGGIEFGDGKTRTIEIKAYDDGYDPQKALTKFQQMVSDGVFAAGIGLGTPTNRAWREAAIDEGVPQVLVMTGDPLFSDREESPMQLGLVPIYQQEGGAFGELLAESGEDHKVAILYQNDDYGSGYVEGFMEAIEGADNVEVVKELTYEATDTSVDAQLTELAASGADVFFNAMSITPLVISSLKKTEELGWLPSWFLPSNTSSPGGILQQPDVNATAFPGIYTVAFSQSAASPTFAESEEGAAFLEAIGEYTNQEGVPAFPHCVWSWIAAATLEQAFMNMEEPTRESFMAALMDIQGYGAPFMLEGSTIDTTVDGNPAVSSVVVQKYNGQGYAPAETFGGE